MVMVAAVASPMSVHDRMRVARGPVLMVVMALLAMAVVPARVIYRARCRVHVVNRRYRAVMVIDRCRRVIARSRVADVIVLAMADARAVVMAAMLVPMMVAATMLAAIAGEQNASCTTDGGANGGTIAASGMLTYGGADSPTEQATDNGTITCSCRLYPCQQQSQSGCSCRKRFHDGLLKF